MSENLQTNCVFPIKQDKNVNDEICTITTVDTRNLQIDSDFDLQNFCFDEYQIFDEIDQKRKQQRNKKKLRKKLKHQKIKNKFKLDESHINCNLQENPNANQPINELNQQKQLKETQIQDNLELTDSSDQNSHLIIQDPKQGDESGNQILFDLNQIEISHNIQENVIENQKADNKEDDVKQNKNLYNNAINVQDNQKSKPPQIHSKFATKNEQNHHPDFIVVTKKPPRSKFQLSGNSISSLNKWANIKSSESSQIQNEYQHHKELQNIKPQSQYRKRNYYSKKDAQHPFQKKSNEILLKQGRKCDYNQNQSSKFQDIQRSLMKSNNYNIQIIATKLNKNSTSVQVDFEELRKCEKIEKIEKIEKKKQNVHLCKKKDAINAKLFLQRQKNQNKYKDQEVQTCTILYHQYLEEKSRENQVLDNSLVSKFVQQLLQAKIQKEFVEFQDSIHKNMQKQNLFREVVQKRIQFIVKHLFAQHNIQVQMYGSSINGLALPSSDLDLVLKGYEGYSNMNIILLQTLFEKLTYFKWVISYQPIFQANVPILKLKINPIISFNSFTYPNPPINFVNATKDYPELNLIDEDLLKEDIHINVDISIE